MTVSYIIQGSIRLIYIFNAKQLIFKENKFTCDMFFAFRFFKPSESKMDQCILPGAESYVKIVCRCPLDSALFLDVCLSYFKQMGGFLGELSCEIGTSLGMPCLIHTGVHSL